MTKNEITRFEQRNSIKQVFGRKTNKNLVGVKFDGKKGYCKVINRNRNHKTN